MVYTPTSATIRAVQEEGVIDRQVAKDAVNAKDVSEKEVLVRNHELEKMRNFQNLTFLARNA